MKSKISNAVPTFIKDYIKMIYLQLKYPGRQICSPMISRSAQLGIDCSIAREVELGPKVCIGDYTYVNAGTIIASGVIGKFCSIGYFCQIGMPTHPKSRLSTSPRTYGKGNIFGLPNTWDDYASPPRIGNDVWVGSSAQIMQGVQIGHGAIIAAGAIVTKNVPPYSIVGGVPAQQIGLRHAPTLSTCLIKLAWWDMPKKSLIKMGRIFQKNDFRHEDMSDINDFLKQSINGN